jgi:long-subunit fatty acid transport protein
MFTQYANSISMNPDYLNGDFQNILSEDWTTAMAFYSEMMRYEQGDGKYYPNGLTAGDKINIYGASIQTGGTEEYTFSMGGNISNSFQFGMTIGLQDLDYINRLSYSENSAGNSESVQYLSSNRDEYTRNKGTGVNAKFGIIYRPIDAFRLGFAIHTPTFFNMTREYNVDMSSNYKLNGIDDPKKERTPTDVYEYTLTTPYRLEFGLAYIFGKIGLISIDYELVGNNSMRIHDNLTDDGYTSSRNNIIKDAYKTTSNVRVGAEINLPRGLMLRAGFNYFQSPYKDSNQDFDRYAYSGGIGYHKQHFFADLAYVLNTSKYHFAPYYVNDYRIRTADKNPDIAVENLKIGRIVATIGFRF